MPTIIDSLLVTIGLDPKGFKAGSKQVEQGLKDTEKNADRTAKDLQAHGKKAAEFFSQIRNQVLALATTFTAGAGLKSFAEHLTTADAAAGRTARNIGVTTETLSTWQGVAERAGGTAEGMTGAMKGLSTEFQHAFRTGNSTVIPLMHMWGVAVGDFTDKRGNITDMNGLLFKLADAFQLSGVSAARAHESFDGVLGEDTVNVLLKGRGALSGMLEEQRKINVLSKEDAAAADRRNAAYKAIGQASEQLGRIFMTQLSPAFEAVAKWLTELAQWFQQNGAAMTVFGAVVGGVGIVVTGALTMMSVKGFLALVASMGQVPAAAAAATAALEGTAAAGSVGLLKMLGALAKSATLVAAAGAVGYAIGSLIWKGLEDTKLGDQIGGFVTKVMASLGDKDAQEALEIENNAKAGLGGGVPPKRAAAKPTTSSGASTPPATRQSKAQAEGDIQRLMQFGWSREQAAGIAANIQAESAGNEQAVGDNGQAFGLAQWHKDRQAAFSRWAGKDIRQASRDEQLQFIDFELRRGSEKAAGAALSKATTAQQAAGIVTRQYERPLDKEGESVKRANIAAALVPVKVDRALLAGAGASAAVAHNTTTNSSSTSSSSTETHVKIDKVIVPDVADAPNFAKGLGPAMEKNFFFSAQANYGLT